MRKLLIVLIAAASCCGAVMVEVTPNGTVLQTKQISTFNYNSGVLTVVVDTIFTGGFEQ